MTEIVERGDGYRIEREYLRDERRTGYLKQDANGKPTLTDTVNRSPDDPRNTLNVLEWLKKARIGDGIEMAVSVRSHEDMALDLELSGEVDKDSGEMLIVQEDSTVNITQLLKSLNMDHEIEIMVETWNDERIEVEESFVQQEHEAFGTDPYVPGKDKDEERDAPE